MRRVSSARITNYTARGARSTHSSSRVISLPAPAGRPGALRGAAYSAPSARRSASPCSARIPGRTGRAHCLSSRTRRRCSPRRRRPSFLAELAGLLVGGTIVAYLGARLGLVPIVGFLIAGVLLGPSALDVIDDRDVIDAAAQVGVILLLFTIGMEFSLDRLARLWRVLFAGGGAAGAADDGDQRRDPARPRRPGAARDLHRPARRAELDRARPRPARRPRRDLGGARQREHRPAALPGPGDHPDGPARTGARLLRRLDRPRSSATSRSRSGSSPRS